MGAGCGYDRRDTENTTNQGMAQAKQFERLVMVQLAKLLVPWYWLYRAMVDEEEIKCGTNEAGGTNLQRGEAYNQSL